MRNKERSVMILAVRL